MLKVLLIKRAALGDILMATPLIRQLKQKIPNLQLDFMCSDEFAGVLRHNQYIDNLITLQSDSFSIRKILTFMQFALSLRGRYDYVFVLDKHYYFNFISRLITKNTVGFVREGISCLFLRYQVRYNDVMRYHGLYYLDLLKASKLALPDYSDYKLDFSLKSNDMSAIRDILQKYDLLDSEFVVVINSGGNNRFESGGIRMLPESKALELINQLCATMTRKVVLLGGRDDEINYNNYLNLIKATNYPPVISGKPGIINLAGQLSLEQSAALMTYAKKIYTTDCGAMHIALSMRLFDELFCFFGPTCPNHVLPPHMGVAYYWEDRELFDKRYPLYGKKPENRVFFTKLNMTNF
jgi:ADP-heptose:LPS heptosyltransferase